VYITQEHCFFVSLRPANEYSGAGCKKGVEGLQVGTINGFRVQAVSLLLMTFSM